MLPQKISFASADEKWFPAELALARKYNPLVDGDSAIFAEQSCTINLRIEVPDLPSPLSYHSSNSHAYSGQGMKGG